MVNRRSVRRLGLALAVSLGLAAGSARAAMSLNTTDATIASGTWAPNSSYTSGPNYSSFTTGQGNSSAQGGSTFTVLSETLTPTSTFNLGAIQVLAQGGTTGNVDQIHLYAISTAPSASASASYNDGQGHDLGPDLLGGGAGYSFGWNPGSIAAGHAWLAQFTFDGADQVALNAGTTYVAEIWSPSSNGNNFVWHRNGGTPADPGGQMFAAHNATLADTTAAGGQRQTINQQGLAGGTPRIASLALYNVANTPPVPEPASIGLLGLVGAALLARRARRA